MSADQSDLLREVLSRFYYDPATGVLTYRKSVGSKKSGSLAGTADSRGYLAVVISGKTYFIHTLVWLIETGDFVLGLDHWDGNTSNNRFDNLRPCNQGQNKANAAVHLKGTGHRGVYWWSTAGKYRVLIKVDYKTIHVGYFDKLDDAVAAYKAAAEQHFGEFAYHRRPT